MRIFRFSRSCRRLPVTGRNPEQGSAPCQLELAEIPPLPPGAGAGNADDDSDGAPGWNALSRGDESGRLRAVRENSGEGGPATGFCRNAAHLQRSESGARSVPPQRALRKSMSGKTAQCLLLPELRGSVKDGFCPRSSFPRQTRICGGGRGLFLDFPVTASLFLSGPDRFPAVRIQRSEADRNRRSGNRRCRW